MSRDPRYDVLFEPLRIGPVTTKNRFYQVPHCTGMGWMRPQTLAAMREVKAEGGWGVVCTEFNSIHPSSDDLPHISATLWDARDERAHALMTEKVHAHGALAGAELWYGGARTPNHLTREVPLDVGSFPNIVGHPLQTRAMDKSDIASLRRWHRKAALRARSAGFDIVYVYATHDYLLSHFLDPRMNDRGDEYGGSLENRTRLVRELIEDTKEAVGDRCAVAVRFSVDETIGADGVPEFGERHEMFAMLAELPDLWDINIAEYSVEMGSSRFVKEGALEPYMRFVKSATTKPVVTVGRFTSPDAMVRQIRQGLVDLIGAARPSIADPFLPRKIEAGRPEDIRECIGCNICYSGDSIGVPIRCTQNPTMGEEWRKGWHPERVAPKRTDARVLVVGAGPAGLEAARALGERGYRVLLAEATRTLGGRVVREAALPGMSEYIRVRDYRAQQLRRLPNVEVYLESPMTADDILAAQPDHVAIATGAKWRRDRFDGQRYVPIALPGAERRLYTPDDIMDGRLPAGPVVLWDAEGYYVAASIAERLRAEGIEVTFVSPSDSVSPWAGHTAERRRMRTRLMELGVEIVPSHRVESFDGESVLLHCAYTGAATIRPAAAVVTVGARTPCDDIHRDLAAQAVDADLPFSVQRIGDCDAPSIIAAAVYAGHHYARELEAIRHDDNPLRHERIDLPPAGKGPGESYLETLLLYYEEEVMGEAHFRALAERCEDTDQMEKLRLLAEIERRAADVTRPIVEKYGLTPRPVAELEALGRSNAGAESSEWSALIGRMRETFPNYIRQFEALEEMANADDLPALRLLTEHEHAALRFLEREEACDIASTEPLQEYLRLTATARRF